MVISKRKVLSLVILAVISFNVGYSQSQEGTLSLPAIIGDHMVLQRDMNASIWGWTDPGETVTVRIEGQEVNSDASDKGEWRVELSHLNAGGPYEMIVSSKRESITIRDILVGDTWVCSGQSNMQWSVAQSTNAEQEIANADYPQIRLFTVARETAEEPRNDCRGEWLLCCPEQA